MIGQETRCDQDMPRSIPRWLGAKSPIDSEAFQTMVICGREFKKDVPFAHGMLLLTPFESL